MKIWNRKSLCSDEKKKYDKLNKLTITHGKMTNIHHLFLV